MNILEQYRRWLEAERNNSENTVSQMLRFTQYFIKWLDSRNSTIEDVSQEIINDYLIYCKQKYSKNSLVPITANLRKLFIHFLNKNLRIKITRISPPNRDKTPLTQEEINRIFKEAKSEPLAEAILKTLYYAGLRTDELINLDIDDVDFNRLQITIKHGKRDESRTVNITRDCTSSLRNWLLIRPNPKRGHENALFISSKRRRISRMLIQRVVKEYASLAGITKQIYPHKFRISMITHMAENGCTLNEIQVQSGHNDIKTLLGYIQHTPARIRNTYDRIFERDIIELPEKDIPEMNDMEYYKKKAFQRYLQGEIDLKTLNNMLHTFEKNQSKDVGDIAYR